MYYTNYNLFHLQLVVNISKYDYYNVGQDNQPQHFTFSNTSSRNLLNLIMSNLCQSWPDISIQAVFKNPLLLHNNSICI